MLPGSMLRVLLANRWALVPMSASLSMAPATGRCPERTASSRRSSPGRRNLQLRTFGDDSGDSEHVAFDRWGGA